MPWLIVLLGIVLAAAGGWSVVHGYPYMQIEFGWTEVIAGTVAVAGGVVTVALAAVLFSLRTLRGAVERAGMVVAPPRDLASPRLIVMEDVRSPAIPPTQSPVPDGNTMPVPDPQASAKAVKLDSPRQPAPTPSPAETRAARSRRPLEPTPKPEAETLGPPTIVGRYQSGASSYVLFSDGTIEVDNDAGKRRFGSMDELKTFMAQQDAEGLQAESLP